MPIAMHLPIGHDLLYRPVCGDWHGLAKMAAKRHCHEQQCKTAGRHPLSLVDNVKIILIIILLILTCASIMLVTYIRSGLPACLDAIIVVLGSWRSAS